MMIMASWQLSARIAVALAGTSLVAARMERPWARRVSAFGREFTVVVALFAVYQYAGHFAHVRSAGAFGHAQTVVDIERSLHLPREQWVQSLVLPHPWLVRVVNSYYAGMHLTSMAAFVVWLWWRHLRDYPRVRNVVAGTTLTCLLVQMVPVAPPRLMTGLGFTDTAMSYGQSMYPANGSGIASQLAAMPSMHVLWASLLAWYAVRLSSSRWRWLLVVHWALTVLVVVASANHWWLDGIAAMGVLALGLAVSAAVSAAGRRRGAAGRVGVPRQGVAQDGPDHPQVEVPEPGVTSPAS